MKFILTVKFIYNKELEVYQSGNWTIEKTGGFITLRHWWVHNDILDIHFWQGTKREAINLIEKIIQDKKHYTTLSKLYKESLY
ncbi:MAG: hypothetical protein AABY22_14725 [Nanoarchaeota archaeon]